MRPANYGWKTNRQICPVDRYAGQQILQAHLSAVCATQKDNQDPLVQETRCTFCANAHHWKGQNTDPGYGQ